MSRYFARPTVKQHLTVQPRAAWGDGEPLVLNHLTVSDHEATDTGLIDHRGDTIWRAPNPLGFGGEW